MSGQATPANRQTDAKASSGPGRPKDLAKRSAILEAAKMLFLRDGFAGTSMDQIAAEAGVSKLTVYSHFGDKEHLFTEAIQSKCRDLMPDELFEFDDLSGSLRQQLARIAGAFFDMASSDEALRIHRMLLAPGNGDEDLRRVFWEAGPARTHAAFGAFLNSRAKAGELDLPDAHIAAQQFFTLVKGELHSRLMCGLCEPLTAAERERHLQAAIDVFLRAYAPR
ncbi:MAG: TetR/AcrR family transcriptional regulator [Pseudoxanthomonas sp.]